MAAGLLDNQGMMARFPGRQEILLVLDVVRNVYRTCILYNIRGVSDWVTLVSCEWVSDDLVAREMGAEVWEIIRYWTCNLAQADGSGVTREYYEGSFIRPYG